VCWGEGSDGAIGDGTWTNRSTPTLVAGLTDATHVAGGSNYTCALTARGSIDCWGYNGFGQLGDGTTVNHDRPAPVVPP